MNIEGGLGNINGIGTISLLFYNYQDSENIRIYVDGDDKRVLAYKSIDIRIFSTIVVPIIIKNIIFNLSVGESYGGSVQLFSDDSSPGIEALTNKSTLTSMKDDSSLFIPTHSIGSLRIILNSAYINMQDTNLEKNIAFPKNGTTIDFFFFYPTEYFSSNPNTYLTTTKTINFKFFAGIILPSVFLYLIRKRCH
ncbi:MAG: hypothetical protein HeimC3_54970 [Candidatus Heimdallarchaeota archaeon LC_3]|nr:MAG: hypothetical protein HeimC3_54970 [Candidatus Heimdallarchaeota archaeon LC_3]